MKELTPAGTFLLQDQGTVTGGVVEGEWFAVPRSGTGELTGLRGTGASARTPPST